MLYTMLTIKNIFCLHIRMNYKESLRRTPRSTNRWFSPCSYQALQQGRWKPSLFWKLPPLSPTPQQTLFWEVGPENTVFLKSSGELSAPLFLTSLHVEFGISPPAGAFCWAKTSGSCLTKEGPCPCLYGLPERPRTFLVIFSKRDNTFFSPTVPK